MGRGVGSTTCSVGGSGPELGTYYVDVALKEAGYDVSLTLNPSAPRTVWDEDHILLTGNGPQAVDEQADRLADILRDRTNTPHATRR